MEHNRVARAWVQVLVPCLLALIPIFLVNLYLLRSFRRDELANWLAFPATAFSLLGALHPDSVFVFRALTPLPVAVCALLFGAGVRYRTGLPGKISLFLATLLWCLIASLSSYILA